MKRLEVGLTLNRLMKERIKRYMSRGGVKEVCILTALEHEDDVYVLLSNHTAPFTAAPSSQHAALTVRGTITAPLSQPAKSDLATLTWGDGTIHIPHFRYFSTDRSTAALAIPWFRFDLAVVVAYLEYVILKEGLKCNASMYFVIVKS